MSESPCCFGMLLAIVVPPTRDARVSLLVCCAPRARHHLGGSVLLHTAPRSQHCGLTRLTPLTTSSDRHQPPLPVSVRTRARHAQHNTTQLLAAHGPNHPHLLHRHDDAAANPGRGQPAAHAWQPPRRQQWRRSSQRSCCPKSRPPSGGLHSISCTCFCVFSSAQVMVCCNCFSCRLVVLTSTR